MNRPVAGARAAGYRLFGHRLDYLLHFRPAEWPIMAAHTALGYVLSVGLAGVRAGASLAAGALGLFVWVVLLNGGTLAINSAFDRDEGDVAYLRQPPPPPRHLFAVGLGAMLLGLALATRLPRGFLIAYAVCVAMSILYSVPPFRLKAVAGADWLINMVGFGTLTPYAGWAATGRPLDLAHALLLAGFCPLFASLYPLTQLYQIDEDTRRGDRTLAVRLGVIPSLNLSIAAALVAFGLFALAGRTAGWAAGGEAAGHSIAMSLAAMAWASVLIPWRATALARRPNDHQRGMYWALAAWAVTDLAVVLAWAA